VVEEWISGTDTKLADKLKQPLLKRDVLSKKLTVNFDSVNPKL